MSSQHQSIKKREQKARKEMEYDNRRWWSDDNDDETADNDVNNYDKHFKYIKEELILRCLTMHIFKPKQTVTVEL